MAKFVYRMQSLLNIQYQLETQAKMELGRAQMRLTQEEEKLQGLIDRKTAYLEEGRRLRSSRLHIMDLKDNRNAMLIMDEKIEDQREQVKFAEKHVEEARNRLQEVMKERKMHEKLREKAFVEFVREENAAEHKAVDELTSYTYGQRSKIKGEQ
ncbi:MAG: flagellar export protein FliJ [Lachnospiraceae bacterium]|jgi:flagellar FliJ protein|nr:flagellar export protein FliJ [Lachnospiraceae bacterium]MCI8986054.1 flagellar export protein FliJ [Lachnospiraceae bacterium]MCI9013790.1 flagellar export protein FliJ [Lachnospiraceae bacterium]MCI9253517.1 flagellar export protein FliJ [Lachnospiraceae bacterium]MDE6902363.1 flagellar export protein FliJ [Lachnospiraceae bacterium]